ncbi:MAG: phage portal protein [Ignavibacteria bacterium]|nr:phage portal protein [Ignavibacteria bacterium]
MSAPKTLNKRVKSIEEQLAKFTVPVKPTAPGKVSSHFISIDNFNYSMPAANASGVPLTAIQKSSKQQDNENPNTLYINPPINPAVAYQLFTQDAYHARACRFKAQCVAGAGYNIVPADKSMENYDNHPEFIKAHEFSKKANSNGEGITSLLVNAMLEFEIYGYGFFEFTRNRKGEIAQMFNMRAINVFAKNYYNKLYYVQRVRGKDIFFRPLGVDDTASTVETDMSEVLMLQNYNPATRYYGLPDWYSATGDLVLSRKIVEYRIKRFDNNLFIQFIIICEGGELDGKVIEDIKKFMASNFKGVTNAGKVLYLNSNHPDVKIRIERIDSDLAESGFIQTRDQSVNYISVAHGIAPVLMGAIIKGALGATSAIKDLFKIFNETIAKPRKKLLEDKINFIFTLMGITKFKFELKELTIETLKEIVTYISALYPMNLISEEEARNDLGFNAPFVRNSTDQKLAMAFSLLKQIKKELAGESLL